MGRWAAGLIAIELMLLAGPAASALADARVRFVNALPGAGSVQLTASEGGITETIADDVAFGDIGSYQDVPPGNVVFEVLGPAGRTIAGAEEEVRNRTHYTVVAFGNGEASLALIRDTRASGGEARLRIVQAAPELGEVDVRLDGRRLAQRLGFEEVARYTELDPGSYQLRVTRPGEDGELASARNVSLTAGSSATAFIVGTGGRPVQVITATDRTAAPAGAPATGLGGLAGERSPVVAALLAGLIAAALGAGGYLGLTGRSRGHGA